MVTKKNISPIFSNFGLVCRYTARSSCKVDLRDYPLDEQICHLAFESCKYNLSKIQSNQGHHLNIALLNVF